MYWSGLKKIILQALIVRIEEVITALMGTAFQQPFVTTLMKAVPATTDGIRVGFYV